ncbi:MAG: ribosome recycling factor [Bacteroidales bacterium]|jgi:ribosome recycling factor|nr:ribosome recycling factor [Bacteroidales bacterium]
MTEESELLLGETEDQMNKSVQFLEKELHKLRTGKATPQMLEGIRINYYGVLTPIEQAANITTPDARQIIVQPWDKSVIHDIDKAIMAANLGLNPKNEGEVLRIIVPPLTEERRRDLVKKAKTEAENAKISIRNIRRSSNDMAKDLEKEGVAEDEVKKLQEDIQKLTTKYIEVVDKIVVQKEKDIMTV